MIKKILLGLVILVVVGLVALYFSINAIIGGGITKVFNQMGPEITGTKTYIESTSVNIFGGSVGINGLYVGNPEGFSKEKAMSCGEVYISVDPSSLFSDEIQVNEIRVVAPSFTFQQTLLSNNLTALKNQIGENVKKFAGSAPQPSEEKPTPAEKPSGEPAQPSKTIRLHQLVVSDGNVDVTVLNLNKDIKLPEIQEDFKGEGVTPAEAADYVLSIIIEKVVVVAADIAREAANDPNAVLKGLTGEGNDAVNEAGKAIQGLFD